MTYELGVDRRELTEALKRLGKISLGKAKGPIVLSHEGDGLLLGAAGATVGCPATGAWPGRVTTSGQHLAAYLREFKGSGSVHLEIREGRLWLDGFAIGCTVDERSPVEIALPLNASVGEAVHAGLTHSRDELDRAGLLPRVTEAEEKYGELASRAAKTLAPLEMTQMALRTAIEQELRRRYG